ncbi:MAG: bifunctional UDP-3-O-[3-hydroxymyristoyl] N-acetylglucosamine deacetylase/3-hydroxyacyl-ACP dehydratase [Chitinophagales bacterium]
MQKTQDTIVKQNTTETVYQQTIKNVVSISGIGLHSGQKATLTFRPAEANFGIRFQRIDLENAPIIKADADFAIKSERCTTLEQKNVKIRTIEHLLAALMALEIDNILIAIDAEEVPILDGSALPFLEILKTAELEVQHKERIYFEIDENFRYYDAEKDAEILGLPANHLQLDVMLDYQSSTLGKQYASLHSLENFETEIAQCRTFCFLHELAYLAKNNLIKGGSLDNALVIADAEKCDDNLIESLQNLFPKQEINIKAGYLNHTQPYFENEAARHKLLDLVGDLALLGMPIKGRIIASKTGHSSNLGFVKQLKTHWKKNRLLREIPKYDPNAPALFDIARIMHFLPHRFPFLLIDKVIEQTSTRVVAIKNVTINEPFFQGHFPAHPVMPGVLVVEAMAQAGGIFLLQNVPDPENHVTYFLRIDKCKFRKPVLPGDVVIFKLDLVGKVRRGLCEMQGTAYANNKIVAEAVLMAKIMKK